MADGTTRFSYGSTEVFHFHGISAFSAGAPRCAKRSRSSELVH